MDIFSNFYDKVMSPFEKQYLRRIRKRILKNAYGSVLEIGVGTGANFLLYPKNVEVTGIEPNEKMLKIAKGKLDKAKMEVELINGHAENIPFEDNTFDTVLATLVLCSVEDLDKSLAEMRRVLKPNGTIILFEHIRLDDPKWVGYFQDVFTPPWTYICGNCHLNRNTIEIAKKYFEFDSINSHFKNIFVTAIGQKI